MFSGNPAIKDLIIELLAQEGGLSAELLHRHVSSKYGKCSLQAIYKELLCLKKLGVILKIANIYSLSISWVVKVLEFGDLLTKNYLENRSGIFEIPSEGRKFSWRFSGVYPADQLWMQIVLRLIKQSGARAIFQFIPHPWHRLFYGDRSTEYEDALRYVEAKSFVIVGGQTYLDKAIFSRWPKDVFVVSSAPSNFHNQGAGYLTVLGNYLIQSEYESALLREIDHYYEGIKSLREVRFDDVLRIFGGRTKVKVTLEHNEKKAAKIARAFGRYFGLRDQS